MVYRTKVNVLAITVACLPTTVHGQDALSSFEFINPEDYYSGDYFANVGAANEDETAVPLRVFANPYFEALLPALTDLDGDGDVDVLFGVEQQDEENKVALRAFASVPTLLDADGDGD